MPIHESEENNFVEIWKQEMKQQLGRDIVPNRDVNGRDPDDPDDYAAGTYYNRESVEKL